MVYIIFINYYKLIIMFKRIKEDLLMVHIRDPAARSSFEIFFCYSGVHAIWYHLISHYLWNHDHYFSARLIASINRFFYRY